MTEKRASIGSRRNPETEAAILEAAYEILIEKGVVALSMEAVARRARAGKATLYRWWPTRGALLLAVYRRQKRMSPYADTGTLEGDVAAMLANLFAHWQRPEGRCFPHIIAAAQSDPDVAEALRDYIDERQTELETLMARAAQRGELRPGSPHGDMARAIIGRARGVVRLGQRISRAGF